MKVVLTKASDDGWHEIIEVETAEDVLALVQRHGTLIVGQDYDDRAPIEFQIYDTYVE